MARVAQWGVDRRGVEVAGETPGLGPGSHITLGGIMQRPDQGSLTASTTRIRSLDGLRGVAAGIVMTSHAFLVIPALARTIQNPPSVVAEPEWWLITRH